MPELATDLAAAIAEACRAGAKDIGEALSRGLGGEFRVEVGDAKPLDLNDLPRELDGSGLVAVIRVGQRALLATLPETRGVVPVWCTHPDATGSSKLATLAQELSLLTLPAEVMADDSRLEALPNLIEAVRRGRPETGAVCVPLRLTTSTGREATLDLFWPITALEAVWHAPKPATPAPAQPKPTATAPLTVQRPQNLEELPAYTRSLLKIGVTARVVLAVKKTALQRIVELGPGSIIHFDQSCEDMLSLEVGGQTIAEGEPVKVGDKFGIRLTSVIIPPEKFKPIARR